MKTITVRVTKTGIKRGLRKDGSSCPIARALHRCGMKSVSVCHRRIEYGWSLQHEVRAPAKARRFIRRFDAGKPVKPFTFTLRMPEGAGR
jgi:hypothetical protein